jgi:hypothetical protein
VPFVVKENFASPHKFTPQKRPTGHSHVWHREEPHSGVDRPREGGLEHQKSWLVLDTIHPDMVWPWSPTSRDHDPVRWRFVLGRFNKERWRQYFQALFDQYELAQNNRNTVKIEVSPEEDAAFAILDIDSLWRDKDTKQEIQWKGRVCKFYTLMSSGDWKFIFQTGPLDYGERL